MNRQQWGLSEPKSIERLAQDATEAILYEHGKQKDVFLREHLDKLFTHKLAYFPERVTKTGSCVMFEQTVALIPDTMFMDDVKIAEFTALNQFPHIVLRWSVILP